MAKKRTQQEALDAWQEAEDRYVTAIEPYMRGDSKGAQKLTKNAAVSMSKARSKADRRRDAYFRRCLD